ncbi:MAG: site-specific integrase [Bacillota bacterium]
MHLTLKQKRGPASLAMTVGDYLKNWLEKIKGTVEERTLETYTWHVKRLISVIGHLQFYNLTAYELQEGMVKLQGKPKTIKGIYGTLKTAFRQAVAWGLINADPTAGLRAPRVPQEEKRVLTMEELHKLLEAAKGYKYYLVIRLLALTGARLGEILGLKWQDVDFKKETLTIKRSADSRRRKLKPEPKTASSKRTMKLDPETVGLLAAHKKGQKVIPLKDNLIFSCNGRVIRANAVRRTLNYALKKAGLDHIRPHDLRHTAGSLLLDAGYSFPTVAAFLGHSSPATTAAVYAHAVRKGVSVANILKDADQIADQSEKSQ